MEPVELTARVTTRVARNEQGRSRIAGIDVVLSPAFAAQEVVDRLVGEPAAAQIVEPVPADRQAQLLLEPARRLLDHVLQRRRALGPLARARAADFVREQIAEAVAAGATPLIDPRSFAADRPGSPYLAPQVLVDVTHGMRVMSEESFGPVIGIQRVSGDNEAVELMNDTDYGLTAGVYTPDESRAHDILARVRSGSAYWNCCDRVSPRLPWSGVGHSGVGLTLSTYGIQTFTRPRAWHLKTP